MNQCKTCAVFEAVPLGRCGPLEIDAQPKERHFCVMYDEGDGIPEEYWACKKQCLSRLEKK